jgi:hypothetical protein
MRCTGKHISGALWGSNPIIPILPDGEFCVSLLPIHVKTINIKMALGSDSQV